MTSTHHQMKGHCRPDVMCSVLKFETIVFNIGTQFSTPPGEWRQLWYLKFTETLLDKRTASVCGSEDVHLLKLVIFFFCLETLRRRAAGLLETSGDLHQETFR
ncbi:hypothetical protein MHYP_G00356490 [Metynnis hypsauchen]